MHRIFVDMHEHRISEVIYYNSFFLFDDVFNGCRTLHKRSLLRVEKYQFMIAFKIRIKYLIKTTLQEILLHFFEINFFKTCSEVRIFKIVRALSDSFRQNMQKFAAKRHLHQNKFQSIMRIQVYYYKLKSDLNFVQEEKPSCQSLTPQE